MPVLGRCSAAVILACLAGAVPASAFTTRIAAAFPDAAGRMVRADLNNDGRMDLAIASQCAVHVLIADGRGSFGLLHDVAMGAHPCSQAQPWIASGDFNGDGNADLALTHGDDDLIWVASGHGDGSFSTGTSVADATASPALGLAAGDLNHDGRDDVVLVARNQALMNPTEIQVLVSGPTGFAAPVRYGNNFHDAVNLTLAHVDADSNLDVVAGVRRCDDSFNCSYGVMEYPGNGDGTLSHNVIVNGISQTEGQFVATEGVMPTELLAAPLRGQGRDEIVVTDPVVQVLTGTSAGTLSALPRVPATIGDGDVGDLDHDGVLDVLTAGSTGQATALTALLGSGDGDFDLVAELPLPFLANSVRALDVNDDGWPDALTDSRGGLVGSVLNTPTIGVDPEVLSFGTGTQGATAGTRTVTVFNGGLRPTRVTGTSVAGAEAGDFSVAQDACSGHELELLDSCDLVIAFNPAGTGTRRAVLRVAGDDPDGPAGVDLIGTVNAPTAPPPPVAQPDRTPPALKVAVAKQRLGDVLRRGLRVRVQLSEAGRVDLTLTIARALARKLHIAATPRPVKVAHARVTRVRAGTATVVLKLSRSARRHARHARRLDLTLTAQAVDVAGNRAKQARLPVRLRRVP